MKLKELFGQDNPFQNLIVAGVSTAKYEIRGHESLLQQKLEQIDRAIISSDYPNNAQHTIVFGEWGHGKTHLLRKIEHYVNSNYNNQAHAVFFEPSESGNEKVFYELCRKLNITAKNFSEFIEGVNAKYPGNLFLLIDETQAMVGEELSKDFLKYFQEYWEMISDLQKIAKDKLVGLHIFHSLSLNSVQEIRRVGQIEAVKEFNDVFSLASLDDESQWKMIEDHLKSYFELRGRQTISADEIINPGVSKCIQKLTGGNPRFALILVQQIFNRAIEQDLDFIDGSVCYQTLCEIPRLDASGLYYFDRFAIKDVMNDLRGGQTFEKKIALMLQDKINLLLGEWGTLEQNMLADYDLRTTDIRRKCNSLKEVVILFDQPPGEDHFRLSSDILRLMQVEVKSTLTSVVDKEELLRLQIEPENMVNNFMAGLKLIMNRNDYHGMPKELQTEKPFSIYLTNLGGTLINNNIKVGIMAYKGKEIPLDLFDKISEEIEKGTISVMIFIEDTEVRHDKSESNFEAIKRKYQGRINIDKRYLFINGTDPSGQTFDEDFFVQLLRTEIDAAEARNWFDRLQIQQRLMHLKDSFLYCPDINEQALIEEFFQRKRSYKLGEIKTLDDIYSWVNRQRLEKLDNYINKDGSSYEALRLEDIAPFKYVLGKLQSAEYGLSNEEIANNLKASFILTGSPAVIEGYTNWLVRILEEQNKIQMKNGRLLFKDNERELMDLKHGYKSASKNLEDILNQYRSKQVDEYRIEGFSNSLQRIKQRLKEIEDIDDTETTVFEYRDAINKLNSLEELITQIPGQVRETLNDQLTEIIKKFETVKAETSWPIEGMSNPYSTLYSISDIETTINELKLKLHDANTVPDERNFRRIIQRNSDKLSVYQDLVNEELVTGHHISDLDRSVFILFNAIRNNKKAKIIIHY